MKKIDVLDDWEWSTLVASWRYYEYRTTIASASFPADIIRRFWGSGKYSKNALDKIARQFAVVDHGLRGEDDWISGLSSHGLRDCDRIPWCRFFAFCEAWTYGFARIAGKPDKEGQDTGYDAFYCSYTTLWYPKDYYIHYPEREIHCCDEEVEDLMNNKTKRRNTK